MIMAYLIEIPYPYSNYMASDDGYIYTTINTRRVKLPNPRMLKHRVSKLGYIVVQLRVCNKNCNRLAHVLVALAFLGDRKGLEVNHIDGVKSNNHISNLEYVTRSQNVRHALDNGLKIPAKGERIARSKLTACVIESIREDVYRIRKNGRAPYGAMKDLAKKYGVTPKLLIMWHVEIAGNIYEQDSQIF